MNFPLSLCRWCPTGVHHFWRSRRGEMTRALFWIRPPTHRGHIGSAEACEGASNKAYLGAKGPFKPGQDRPIAL